MSTLPWSNDYCIKIPAIDNEHRLLLALINDIDATMCMEPAYQLQFADVSLDRLSRCIHSHFESEERFLLFNNYPEFNIHKKEHTILLERLDSFEQRFKAERRALNERMLLFLKDWLVRHIILYDSKFGHHYRDQELIDHFG